MLTLGSAFALATGLAACTETTALSTVDSRGDNRNSVPGDRTVQKYPRPGAAVFFSGSTERGGRFRSRNALGKVLVVNTWYAACPACRAEAPLFRRLSEQYANQAVQFVGVNVRDEAGQALAFDREFRISYPSILDADSGAAQYALRKYILPNAVPTTLVLDRRGRVRARILGQLMAASILATLIDDLLAGGS